MESKEEPIVLENTVVETYKSNIAWAEPIEEVGEPSAYEIERNKNTKTIEKLLEEERNEINEELTEEQLLKKRRRDYITKVKVIALYKMGKHPLANPSLFSKKDKQLTIKTMEEVMKEDEDVINILFNEICNDELFNESADFSTYPVYNNPI